MNDQRTYRTTCPCHPVGEGRGTMTKVEGENESPTLGDLVVCSTCGCTHEIGTIDRGTCEITLVRLTTDRLVAALRARGEQVVEFHCPSCRAHNAAFMDGQDVVPGRSVTFCPVCTEPALVDGQDAGQLVVRAPGADERKEIIEQAMRSSPIGEMLHELLGEVFDGLFAESLKPDGPMQRLAEQRHPERN